VFLKVVSEYYKIQTIVKKCFYDVITSGLYSMFSFPVSKDAIYVQSSRPSSHQEAYILDPGNPCHISMELPPPPREKKHVQDAKDNIPKKMKQH